MKRPFPSLMYRYRWSLAGIALFSAVANVLMLTGAFFMLQVYDRVLPSRSVETLAALAVLAGGLVVAYGLLDMVRQRIMSRLGTAFDRTVGATVFDAVVAAPLRASVGGRRAPALLRDLDSVRMFLTGQGPMALFDLPWLPIYLGVLFAFHGALGWTAVCGIAVLVGVAIVTEFVLRRPTRRAARNALERQVLAEAGHRNAEAVVAMGMLPALSQRWREISRTFLTDSQAAADISGGTGSLSRALRMVLQLAMLTVGAYLVIDNQATAGIIIASSILAGRVLAPIDLALANWRGLVAARQSLGRITEALAGSAGETQKHDLPPPARSLAATRLFAVPPGHPKATLRDISFSLQAGSVLGIIGPSGSGKSTLARVLVGAWPCARGRVELDGAALTQWPSATLGRHIGYLPQDLELFAGTIGENIARFDPSATPDRILRAARAAGVHEMIVAQADGYDTVLGPCGVGLSAGQRQRIALARALYGEPFLVVLDEPNSNLDGDGETALQEAIRGVRARGGIAIVIAHRRSTIAHVDHLLVLQDGGQTAFGARDSVLAETLRSVAAPQPTTSVPRGAVLRA